MKKKLAIIILMGFTKRNNLKGYWSTDPFLEIPIFGKLINRKRFEQIWVCLHFNYNELQPQSTGRLFKIQPLLDILVEKFHTVYKPDKVALWLINCALFNSFSVLKKVNRNSTLKYKAFLLNLAKAWATDLTVAAVPASDTDVV
ncbi:hypothetical protein B7P43_G18354 [Cryptotermes secundus]|uniref:PiggyBac transposable element-derived protein domain-containing protein n=1 Tax=Cryptotermes secundus TaxID=105785 RepID=A0A2J7RQL6_9NEOP|nr:hypothetical protein B7P43_G18354 [Cryptotermes secundus]